MRRLISDACFALLLCGMCLTANGCTVVGAGLGHAVDQGARKNLPAEEVVTIRPGQKVTLLLSDGRRVKGTLEGLELNPPREYHADYDKARESRPYGLELPQLGAEIQVQQLDRRWSAQMIGFDRTSLRVQPGGKPEARSIPFRQIVHISDDKGMSLNREQLARLTSEGDVPLLSRGLRVSTKDGPDQTIELDQIEGVSYNQHKGLLFGAAIGLVGDILLVGTLRALESSY